LADEIFLDIGLLDALEADANIARQHVRVVVRAGRIDRQAVRRTLTRGFTFFVHNNASISRRRASGGVVGACRATTLPERSTRNLVKFHLIEDPSRPYFSRFR